MSRLFISYRRSDNRWAAHRLSDWLTLEFGAGSVFIDVGGIPAGADFRSHIRQEMDQCDLVLLAMAGNWRRIFAERRADPTDYVRMEMELVLERGLPVIPVLLGTEEEVDMICEDELPPQLRPLAHRNFVRVEPDESFESDVKRLIREIKNLRQTRHRPASFRNSWGMEMIGIPSGTGRIGATPDDPEVLADEPPSRTVSFPQGFWLGQHPVTVAQYRAIAGENAWATIKSRFPNQPGFAIHQEAQKAITRVTWEEARQFCDQLTLLTHKAGYELPLGHRYRLPTEGEWEYACRADASDRSRYDDLPQIAWVKQGEIVRFADVGTKRPNAWALFDMLGLVFEWCSDPVADGRRPVRGGSYADEPQYARASARAVVSADKVSSRIGFRVAIGMPLS